MHELFPEWDIWPSFVSESITPAFKLDTMTASHPIQVDVEKPSDVNSIFDVISYEKSSSVLRCLQEYLTPPVFVAGLSAYLKVFLAPFLPFVRNSNTPMLPLLISGATLEPPQGVIL